MELKDFIRTTLENIATAADVTYKCGEIGYRFHVADSGITFDLAVSVSSDNKAEKNKSAGAGIKVLETELDSKESIAKKNETISRVRFTIDSVYENGSNARVFV